MGGVLHTIFDGNRQACNVWWNDANRKANLNKVADYGNANDWFAFRYSLCFLIPLSQRDEFFARLFFAIRRAYARLHPDIQRACYTFLC